MKKEKTDIVWFAASTPESLPISVSQSRAWKFLALGKSQQHYRYWVLLILLDDERCVASQT